MTDVDESRYLDRLERELVERHGAGRVLREPVLTPSGREPDFLLHVWPFILAIEVEDRPADVPGGVGQASLYSGLLDRSAGAVIHPPDHTDDYGPELAACSETVPLAAVDPDDLPEVDP